VSCPLLARAYPPHNVKGLRDPEAEAGAEAALAYGHPFHDAEPAADGNIYSRDSKLRPASAGEPNSIEDFIEYVDVPPYCIANSGQPLIFTFEPPNDSSNDKSKPTQR
jgi:hypothetical protein